MIAYNDLYEVLRKERYSEQLQPLAKNFIVQVAEYFRDKKEMSSKETDMFSEAIVKAKKQYENAVAIFKELILRRKKKLLDLAFIAIETGISKRDFDNMMTFEKEIFDKLMKALEKGDKDIDDQLKGQKDTEKKNKMIVFIKDTEEFLDMKGEKIGPFKIGNIVNVAQEIANILIIDGKAEGVDEE